MSVAMVTSIIAIYLALVLQFNSPTKPLLVFAAVPFGMIGEAHGPLDLQRTARVLRDARPLVTGRRDHQSRDRLV